MPSAVRSAHARRYTYLLYTRGRRRRRLRAAWVSGGAARRGAKQHGTRPYRAQRQLYCCQNHHMCVVIKSDTDDLSPRFAETPVGGLAARRFGPLRSAKDSKQ